MSLHRILIVAICCLVVVGANAEQIELADGSKIQGRVLSMNNGSYTIETQSMGVITLRQDQVRSISQGGASVPAPATSASSSLADQAAQAGQSAVQSLQSAMTSNEGVMASIMQLQSDPDMQAVLQDPEVMQAIQSMDFETLRNHPKIKKLMNNSKVRSIQGRVN